MLAREKDPSAAMFHTAHSGLQENRRQVLFGLLLLLFPYRAAAQPKLGDEEWYRRFRAFVKDFNAFVNALNDGRLDLAIWRKMHETWKKMDCD